MSTAMPTRFDAMPPDVTGNFSAAGGVANVDCVLQIKLFGEGREIVGIGVHVVAVPGLGGAAVPSPVMRDDAKTLLAEEQHLSVPVVRGKRPAVTEYDGLSGAPVFVVDLRSVFHSDCRHDAFSFRVNEFDGLSFFGRRVRDLSVISRSLLPTPAFASPRALAPHESLPPYNAE